MVRLGLNLTLRSGREALVRLLVTMAAVGIGVGLLLSVLAIYHGYEVTQNRACWQCTAQDDRGPSPLDQQAPLSTAAADDAELWNYGQDFYQGRAIERVAIAPLGPAAPIVPGLSRLPDAGQYYASPALASLIATVPRDQLGDRFPGTPLGLIGPDGLSGPDDLAIVMGDTPGALASQPATIRITAIRTEPRLLGTTNIYAFGFALGAVALLVPMLVLIGNATRLATTRREERYAAMRLVGATTRQVSVVASVDAVVGTVLGALLGIAIYAALHPLAAQITITGSRFFANYVTPTGYGYAAVLIAVPAAVAVVSLLSLRRVGISPLGVARRALPAPPRAWRVVPLLTGVVLFIVPLAAGGTTDPNVGLAALSLLLVMVGLMIGGTWLTMQSSRVLARLGGGASSLLAARRLADNPRVAFRSVSGLVLAAFVGTLLAGAVPAALAAQQTATDAALTNVLRVPLSGPDGIGPQAAATLVGQLQKFDGTTVLPIYGAGGPTEVRPDLPPPLAIVGCASLAHFAALGTCAPGVTAVRADLGLLLFTDNVLALNRGLPIVTPSNAAVSADLAELNVAALLVKVDNAATLEQVRTFLAVTYPDVTGSGVDSAPQTIGEVAQVRAALYIELGNVVLLLVGLTLLVAGCSLAIAMGGGMIERKRPFTLLRVSGTSTAVLRRVVLVESVLPLVGATLVAAVTGFVLSIPIGEALTGLAGASGITPPGPTYFLTMGSGLILSFAIILVTLPLLNRITVPDNVRFE